jgi:outer membrane receptor protein involved in Fe transport
MMMRTKKARSNASPLRRGPRGIPAISRTQLAIAVAAALSGAAAMRSGPALAAASAATDASSDSSLTEIVVTARKRAENLQDVPLSIDVFTSKDLQNMAISQFEDYATMTPSISFVSAGPGTQTFVMRGVSDGSNSNYANTASTLFLLDDMSMNYYGTTPDLHLYDIQQIEVLNGPQGTTFGAGAMAGALRFTTNKPDPTAFDAGIDLDGGKIQDGGHNGVVEGYINLPIVPDWTAIRISAYSDYHGGFINNLPWTRTWVNGVTSNNYQWSGKDYNVEKVTGARVAISQKFSEGWKASLTYSYQKQLTHGAWDEDPTIGGVDGPVHNLPPNDVIRFGPEYKQYYAKTLDLHVDGDVGIGDLVFASTYWAQDNKWVNEYSEYMQYLNYKNPAKASYNNATQQGYVCSSDPYYGPLVGSPAAFTGCKAPIQYYDYDQHIDRWSDELRLQSKEGGRFHWLTGLYWEKTRDEYSNIYHMPGLNSSGAAWTYTTYYYGVAGAKPPSPDDWYSYVARSDYLQTTEFANVTFDITPRLKVEAGTVHFHSNFSSSSYGGFWYSPETPTYSGGGSTKWNSKLGLNYKLTDDILLYVDAAQGFRDGGSNSGIAAQCLKNGAPLAYTPDTLTNYEFGWKTTWMDKHLLWNGALYYMPWHNFQTLIFDPNVCASSSFNANVGNARIYGAESNVEYQPNQALNFGVSGSYNDSRMISNFYGTGVFAVDPGQRLPYVPYFSWSANARYEEPVKDSLHAFVQYDASHKGDMWNDLLASGSNGLPRVLQPGYTVMDVRFGLTDIEKKWVTEFYVTNLLNKNAIIYTNEGNFDLRQTRNEPRVFGLRLSYKWGAAKGGG